MRIVAPTLFKMIGRGFRADPYAHDGIHLRWFVAPEVGFPRAPFQVWIRRGIDGRGQIQGHSQNFDRAAIADARVDSTLFRFADLQVYREHPHTVDFDGQLPGGIGLMDAPLYLDFRTGGGPQGVSYVEVVLRLRRGGQADVEAQQRGPHAWYVVDREAARSFIRPPIVIRPPIDVPPPIDLPPRPRPPIGGGPRPFPPAPPPVTRVIDRAPAADVERPRVSVLHGDLLARLFPDVRPGLQQRDTFVILRLRGDRIGRLALTGLAASVLRVTWVYTDAHANARDWEHIADFFLPVADTNGQWYPNWSANPLDEAMGRLLAHPANARDPWDEPTIPPPAAPPPPDHYLRCYVEPYRAQFDRDLLDVLQTSLFSGIKQRAVERTEPLDPPQNPAGGTPPPSLTVAQTITYVPLLSLLTAVYEPHFARLMGMYTVQNPPDPDQSWDYMVTSRWNVKELGEEFFGLREFLTDEFLELASIVPALRIGTQPLPPPPADFKAILDQQTAPGSGAVAHTRLTWQIPLRDRPPDPESIGLLYALARNSTAHGLAGLNAKSEISGCPMPFIPDDHLDSATPEPDVPENYAVFRDRTVPGEDTYTYRVSGSDPFGRWSPWTETPWTFVDTVPPSAPVNVRAFVIDPADPQVPGEAKTWAADKPPFSLRVQFDWPAEAAANAPDLAFFRVHVRQGVVGPSDPAFRDPSSWGRIHYSAVSSSPALRFDASGSNVSIHPDPTPFNPVRVHTPTAYTETTGTGGTQHGTRYTVDLSGFTIPIGANGQGRVSVAVSAIDARGNESDPAGGPAPALLIDRTPPSPVVLPAVDKATYADATGRSFYEIRWLGQAAVRYAIWRGVETKLLDVATHTERTNFNSATTVAQRGVILREIAAAHPEALVRLNQRLVPDEELVPVVSAAGPLSYRDELPGGSRNLYVYTVVGTSVTGVDTAMPTNSGLFTAVEVPQRRTPGPPAWSRVRPTSSGVELTLRLDQSAETGAVEIYRTLNQARAEDVRQMLSIARITSGALPDVSGDDGELEPLVVIDPTAKPWRRYYYRAVARALADDSGVLGARSAPSPTASVLTFQATPPSVPMTVGVVEATPAPGRALRLTWSSIVPFGPVEQGVFRFGIWRKGASEANFVQIASFATNDRNPDFTATVPPSTPPGTQVEVAYGFVDAVPPDIEAGVVSYFVRVVDPLSQFANSSIVMFTPGL